MDKDVKDLVAFDDREGRLAQRGIIDGYEDALKEFLGSERGEMDEINDKGLKQHLVHGAYIRELFIEAGVTIVSKLWNRDRFWIITEGDVTVTTELGRQRIVAPYHGLAPFGTKVALYTHAPTRWFAITGVQATSVDECEDEVTASDYAELTYPWEQGQGDES